MSTNLRRDFEDAFKRSWEDVIIFEEFLDKGLDRIVRKGLHTEPRAHDDLIRAALDLLGALIISKADAEMLTRFNDGRFDGC